MLGLVTASSLTQATTDCTNQACLASAQSIQSYVDTSVNPCDDFYQYTCRQWINSVEIPEDQAQIGTFRTTTDSVALTIQRILEGSYDDLLAQNLAPDFVTPTNEPVDRASFAQLQEYYQSCMNQEAVTNAGPSPLYAEIGELQKAIAWNSSTKDHVFVPAQHAKVLTNLLVDAANKLTETMVSFWVQADDMAPDKNAIFVYQPSLSLSSKEYYSQPSILETYKKSLVELVMAVFGAEKKSDIWIASAKKANVKLLTHEEVADLVSRVIDFETKLAEFSLKSEELQDPVKTYNPMTLDELEKAYPIMEWRTYLASFVPQGTPLPDKLINTTPAYFEKLTAWLTTGKVSLKTIEDYFKVRQMLSWTYSLDENTRQLLQNIHGQIISGSFKLRKRSRFCVDIINSSFGHGVGRYYVMTKFGGEASRKATDQFVMNIHKTWLDRLGKLDWLDDTTRAAAIDKVNKIKHKVGYSTVSPNVGSPESLKKWYAHINITASFFDNELSIAKSHVRRAWEKVGRPVDKDEWHMFPQDVNAYYSPQTNEIAIPAAILQMPMYDLNCPAYLNYGGMGAIIGHELTHAFDNMGRMYDGDGFLRQWWSNQTTKMFETRSQDFVDQYNKFTISGPGGDVHVNGKLTLGENLADNGGLAAAYTTFVNLWANLPSSDRTGLPGLDMTPEQLFFINYARTWCDKIRPEEALNRVYSDPHSPAQARVNGVAQNSADFAKAFKCDPGSPMNPVKKASVW
ncbi:hypothetical protein BX666DRAFT_1856748 [Dichotomocladium elegans]|nr:hypothetical protein BX666DRAFT_1856748 [Dichotomocladium elegans]